MFFSKKFIAAGTEICSFDTPVAAPYFRKEFDLSFTPEEAELTLSGLGFYEVTVNGKNITKGPLAPYISNPDDLVYYDTYDIAPYLTRGKNAIGLLLGNGMRNAFGGFVWDFDKASSRGPVCLALYLAAKGEGKELSFEADESFMTHPSPITFDDLRMGYRYDARSEMPGWDLAGFDDSTWRHAIPCEAPKGEAKLCEADPIAVRAKHTPVSITHYDELPFAYDSNVPAEAKPIPGTVRKNVYVYDFGINTAGVTVLHINGRPGQKITVRHGEYLLDGKFSQTTTMFLEQGVTELYCDYAQCDEFICKGGEETFVPRFKFDGFRYAYVEGLTPEQATKDALTYYEMSGSYPERGSFSSSSEVLNRLYAMTVNSDRSNFYYFPTDCPHREKNGWTGDASMSAEHMLLHMKAEKSLREWLFNVRKAQNKEGALPGIVPTGGWGFAWGNGPTWDSVLFSLPLEIYRHTGDKSVITENAAAMCRYLAYAKTKKDARGLCAFGLGDWLDPYVLETKKIASPLEVTDSIMLSLVGKIAAFLFGEAGLSEEKAFAEAFAADMKKAVRDHLIDYTTMTVAGDCQTSQVFALAAGIFTEEERPKAEARLLSILHRNDDENACGMIGIRFLFRVLLAMGETDLAFRVMTSEKRTGYGAWVKRGKTSLLENFSYENGFWVCSENHHFLGDILAVMTEYFAGLIPNPTYRDIHSFLVAPKIPTALSHAEAHYEGPDGRLSVKWVKEKEGEVLLTLTVPEGAHGKVLLGTKETAVSQSGNYSFRFRP